MKKIFHYVMILSFFSGSLYFAQVEIEKAKKFLEEKNYDEAKELLESILDKNENNAEAYFLLGKVYMSLKEFEDASESFELAVELEDNNSEYHFWLGNAYGQDARESNVFSQAFLAPKIKSAFKRAVELDAKNIRARVGLSQYYLQAPGLMGGDVDSAIVHGKILLNIDEANGRIILASAYIEKEQIDLAQEQYRLLLNKFGNDKKYSGVYNSYGYMLLNENKIDDAITAFKKQVELSPDRANSYDSLGDGYKAAGKYILAKESYEKALSIDPEFEASVENLEEIEELIKK